MTKDEFRKRWESDNVGGGITFEDIAKCAKDWGLLKHPRTHTIEWVRYKVLEAANTEDYRDYYPIS